MTKYERDDSGKFITKADEKREVRSIRATDSTWKALLNKANDEDMTIADYLEALVNEDIIWDSDAQESETELDFDVDEVVEILTEALELPKNNGSKVMVEIRKVLKLMGREEED